MNASDVWASIRNVQSSFRAHVTEEVRNAVEHNQGHPVADSLILSGGELIRLEGSDITHFAYRGVPILAWTHPKMEVDNTLVRFSYRLGVLPKPSEETLRVIREA